jgi:hypothetical protein
MKENKWVRLLAYITGLVTDVSLEAHGDSSRSNLAISVKDIGMAVSDMERVSQMEETHPTIGLLTQPGRPGQFSKASQTVATNPDGSRAPGDSWITSPLATGRLLAA